MAAVTKKGSGAIFGDDRKRIDAGIENAETTGLPDPFLAGVPPLHVFFPGDGERGNSFALEALLGLLDPGIVLRMPGGEEHAAAGGGLVLEIGELAHRRCGRLFEKYVLAGDQRLQRHGVAHAGRGTDRHRIEVGQSGIKLGRRAEGR